MKYQIGSTVFKDWKITRELGEGAYGKVFEIQKSNFGITTTSALKVLGVPKSQSDVRSALSEGMDEQSVTGYFRECVERFVKEIAILSELKSHPHIVGYEDHDVIPRSDEFGWDILIRMELLTPLQDHQRKSPMTEQDAIRLGIQMCDALDFCHKKGLIHRDIKPGNIFVNQLGQFKLGDFGVARNMEATISNMSKAGTEGYMAPEVYWGQPYGPNADLYSLALMLFSLTNGGRLPFLPPAPQPLRFSDREAALQRRLKGEPLPTPVAASIGFADVIRKAGNHDPKKRYQTAAEMKAALEALKAGNQPIEDPDHNDWRSEPSRRPDWTTGHSSKMEPPRGSLEDLEELTFGMDSDTDSFKDKTFHPDPGTIAGSSFDEEEEMTEKTVSIFSGQKPKESPKNSASDTAAKPQQGAASGTSGKVQTRVVYQKSPWGWIKSIIPADQELPEGATEEKPSDFEIKDIPEGFGGMSGDFGDIFSQFFGNPASANTQTNISKEKPQKDTPSFFYDRVPTGINKEVARMNQTPGKAEAWVTRAYMFGIIEGTLPNACMETYLSNGIYWGFSGNTLKNYMKDLYNTSLKGLNDIIIVNRFPELGNIQESIHIHLVETKPGQVRVAHLDGISSGVKRLGTNGQWVSGTNAKPQFFSNVDNNSANPFYGIRSPLHMPPVRALATPLLAKSGGVITTLNPQKRKISFSVGPFDPTASLLTNVEEEYIPGQWRRTSKFYRIEAVKKQVKGLFLPEYALWIPDERKIYTAANAAAAKNENFKVIIESDPKYRSLLKLFEETK